MNQPKLIEYLAAELLYTLRGHDKRIHITRQRDNRVVVLYRTPGYPEFESHYRAGNYPEIPTTQDDHDWINYLEQLHANHTPDLMTFSQGINLTLDPAFR
jgi:hypothetical protein